MMKKFLFVLLLYCPTLGYTQGWSIDYSIGYGSYQLDDIKSLQYSMHNYYGLKETDNFPNHIIHSASLGYNTGSHHFGSIFSYLTTGGRLHRADYSGSYTVDLIMEGYRVGAFYRYYINIRSSPVSLYLQMSPGVLFSNLNMTEQIYVYSESVEESLELKGLGIYFEPSIGATYRFTDWLQFSLGGGYEIDIPGTMKLSGRETQIKSNWNGFRFYGGLIFFYQVN